MSRSSGVLAVLLAASAALAVQAGPAAAQDAAAPAAPASGAVTVVHGVRGLVADVRLDGDLVLSGFAPERVTDPLVLSAGSHRVQVWPSGAPADAAPVLDATLDVAAGARLTAAIGLAAAGGPVLTTYDDTALLPAPGSTALAVRGLAASPAVKVLLNGQPFDDSLTPTDQQVQQVQPGTYGVSVLPAVGDQALVPAEQIPVEAGRATVLYLIGSQSDGTLGWVAQTVRPEAAAAPLRIDTGVGPLPASESGSPVPAVLGAAALALAGAGVVRRRAAGTMRTPVAAG